MLQLTSKKYYVQKSYKLANIVEGHKMNVINVVMETYSRTQLTTLAQDVLMENGMMTMN